MPGDAVVADRGLYRHYGIYIGNDQVIHFGSEEALELNPMKASVIMTSLKAFRGNCPFWVAKQNRYPAFPSDQVVDNAKARLGERGYSILNNNCEHFANECKYGIKESRQVKAFLMMAGLFFVSRGMRKHPFEAPVYAGKNGVV